MHRFENSHRQEQETSREPFVAEAYAKYVRDVYSQNYFEYTVDRK